MKPNPYYSAVILEFITESSEDHPSGIFSKGIQSGYFTFVSNVVNSNIWAATKQFDLYGIAMNISCHEQGSLCKLVAEVNTFVGKNIISINQDSNPGDVKHSFATISLIKVKIGFEVALYFAKSLPLTIYHILRIN